MADTDDTTHAPGAWAVRDAVAKHLAALEADPDKQRAIHAAAVFARDMHDMAGEASGVRNRIAVAIRDAERLSLAGLASRISVSKSLAQQWVGKADQGPKQREVADG